LKFGQSIIYCNFNYTVLIKIAKKATSDFEVRNLVCVFTLIGAELKNPVLLSS